MSIETLFFNLGDDVEAPTLVFNALGLPFNQEGSSTNSLNGEYSALSIFGVSIKFEANTYDYEDDYRYMVSVYKDRLTELVVDQDIVLPVAKVIARLLADNLGVVVAHEVGDRLEIFKPSGSSS